MKISDVQMKAKSPNINRVGTDKISEKYFATQILIQQKNSK